MKIDSVLTSGCDGNYKLTAPKDKERLHALWSRSSRALSAVSINGQGEGDQVMLIWLIRTKCKKLKRFR